MAGRRPGRGNNVRASGRLGSHDAAAQRGRSIIIRLSETDALGLTVPVIMDASAYYASIGRGNQSQVKPYAAAGTVLQLPLVYDNYFVPREYAILQPDLIGTNKSKDCVHVGGAYEVACAKAVVYGLRGRAQAHTTIARTGASAPASWSSGKVGMV